MGNKVKLALIGKDVSKSNSPKIHAFILKELGYDLDYELISLRQEELPLVMRRLFGEFDGFNVTMPYKREVFKYLDGILGDAAAFGSVNTVVTADKKGYNTDGLGFMQMLNGAGVEVREKNALVLGAGGAGRSVALSLKNAGSKVSLYRRNRAELEKTCEELGVLAADNAEKGGYDILINATGVGMNETVGVSPVRKSAFAGGRVAVDLICRPQESEFLRLAKGEGLKTLNGEAMLFYQAYYSDCYYVSRPASEKEAEMLYQKYLEKLNEK